MKHEKDCLSKAQLRGKLLGFQPTLSDTRKAVTFYKNGQKCIYPAKDYVQLIETLTPTLNE